MNTCMQCGEATHNPKFCGLSCAGKYQKGRRPNLIDRTVICKECGTEFQRANDPEQKFCSRSCSAKFNNTGRYRTPESECLNCSIRFRPKVDSRRKFCSTKCSGLYKRADKISQWLSGEHDGNTKHGLSRAIRQYLIDEAGEKCQDCGWGEKNPVTGKAFLEVEHIDGNCFNNNRENLKVLCPNCHSLTPTYKALNSGSGRAYRGEYNQFALTTK